ncbi:MAG: TfoX/Sxy family protein [Clostridia bacterium]|nr:TfoX/Sxy family protein [Clostridia bacterium]MBR0509835.1 TfoX/Sxy family protein [Clostridia bacterium]
MAASREYLDYILEQLSDVPGITFRPMMGEYVLYCRGKVFGGIYDDRFLVKPVPAAVSLMPDAEPAVPYPGAKEMLTVEETDDREFLRTLVEAMFQQLPGAKR